MAVAAYASVLSLIRVTDNIQHPSRIRLFPNTTQIEALREKLCFLQQFLELHSPMIREDIECLARKIPEVTNNGESIIDKYLVEKLYRKSEDLQSDHSGWNMESFHNEMHQVIQEIESINEALMTLRTIQHDQEQPRVSLPSLISSEKKTVVGFDNQIKQVLNKLTGNQPNLEIISIVGMGGIGKTTLARSVFNHPYNLHHFHMRIWLTISQDYSVKNILQGLLEDGILGDMKDRELGDESEADLITRLHKKLFGQRYLIVLDDVWSVEAWDDLRRGFPNNSNGSRVMVTTRLSDVASSLGSPNINTHSMQFLDEDNSWNLFSDNAFKQGGQSLELEKIGRRISRRCKGLPLLLVVIGGQLANSNMTVEYWQIVAEGINSFANSAYDEYCLRILSLSYHHLPIHLKPCFLYMRHFEEDSRIDASKLIKSWVAQGFVKPINGKSLEEAARKYMQDLIGRNMFLIRERRRSGNIKICGIHDLLRDLCIKEYNKEHVLEVPRAFSVVCNFNAKCFHCKAQNSWVRFSEIHGLESTDYGKILLCKSCESKYTDLDRSRFAMVVETGLQNVFVTTKCRGLSIDDHWGYSNITIHLLWKLEILDIGKYFIRYRSDIPKEIWELPQLRHVKIRCFWLPDPPGTTNNVIVLENLQTLKTVTQFKCTEEIVRRIPDLKSLHVQYEHFSTNKEEELEWPSFYLQNLARLQKLESFSIYCNGMVSTDFNRVIAFPSSLKKLTLRGCKISWDNLTIIGSLLPNLQVLKLLRESVLGEEWDPIEGEFLRLKCLALEMLDLVDWRVNETHFPALETLIIMPMKNLQAIPREIGELPSLHSIYLILCSDDLIGSAKVLVEEQQSNGNEGLVVHGEIWGGPTYQIGGTNV